MVPYLQHTSVLVVSLCQTHDTRKQSLCSPDPRGSRSQQRPLQQTPQSPDFQRLRPSQLSATHAEHKTACVGQAQLVPFSFQLVKYVKHTGFDLHVETALLCCAAILHYKLITAKT